MRDHEPPHAGERGGTLLVVATPIGHLDDVSPRMLEALRTADLIAAEDTRHTGRLLAHFGIHTPQVSCHKFNEARGVKPILEVLQAGRTVALVSDGGTPAISDPGSRLVAAAHEDGHRVVPIPGPSAVIAALSASGMPSDRFHFAGFLPSREVARRRELQRLAPLPETLVLYEAPHRLRECLVDLTAVLGDRPAALCRELTKLHEEILVATLGWLREEIEGRESIRGEIVLVVGGCPEGTPAAAPAVADTGLERAWKEALEGEDDDERRALRRLAREMGIDRAALRRRLQAALIL